MRTRSDEDVIADPHGIESHLPPAEAHWRAEGAVCRDDASPLARLSTIFCADRIIYVRTFRC